VIKFFLQNSWLNKIQKRPVVVKILKNINWLFLDKIIRLSIGLFVGAWVARYLGPEKFGLFNYASALVGIFAAFASMGLNSIIIRDVVKSPDAANVTLGSAFLLQVIGSFFALFFVIFFTIFWNINDKLLQSLIYIFAFSLLFKSCEPIKYWFHSQLESKYIVIVENSVFLIVSLIKILLILTKSTLIAFAFMTLLDSILVAMGLIYIYIDKKGSLLKWSPKIKRSKELLLESWPVIFASAVLMVQARVDQLMIGSMMQQVDVGYYSSALYLIEGVCFIPMILMSSIMPSIVEAKKHSLKKYRMKLYDYYRINFVLFILVALPIFIFSEKIIYLLFGKDYAYSAILLSAMTFRLFFANMGVAREVFIINDKLLKFSFYTMVAGTLVNILLNYLLIPLYGSLGAIYASYVSFFVTSFFIDIFYKKTRGNIGLMFKAIIFPWKRYNSF
jgi:O-antigen/teichoic acid export membrane protein